MDKKIDSMGPVGLEGCFTMLKVIRGNLSKIKQKVKRATSIPRTDAIETYRVEYENNNKHANQYLKQTEDTIRNLDLAIKEHENRRQSRGVTGNVKEKNTPVVPRRRRKRAFENNAGDESPIDPVPLTDTPAPPASGVEYNPGASAGTNSSTGGRDALRQYFDEENDEG